MTHNPLFVLTVDTEADDAWSNPEIIELKNLREIPKFQRLCDKYSVIPTYLVAYECATRDEALSVLKPFFDSGKCEIGHHLHCWTTPPFQKEEPSGIDTAWLHAYQSELPDSLFMEKAEALRVSIEKAYGRSPTSHRAGRWGIDQRTINWLIQKDFLVDSSVVPLTSYARNPGIKHCGPSFHGKPRVPYSWFGNDQESIVELPVTVDMPENPLARLSAYLLEHGFSLFSVADWVFRQFGGARALRPNPIYPPGFLRAIILKALKAKLPVLNLMIHSSELAIGCSPFSRTKEDCNSLWSRLAEAFTAISELGIKSTSLTKTAAIVKAKLFCRHTFRENGQTQDKKSD